MACIFCKGKMEDGQTTHIADADNCVIVIKNVPCKKCVQCGEVTYNILTGERIEQIIKSLKNSLAEVAIIKYTDEAA